MDNVESVEYYEYVTEEKDTFDLIAYREYKNEFIASKIIELNTRYADTIFFDAGIILKLPVIEVVDLDESLPPWRQPGGEND